MSTTDSSNNSAANSSYPPFKRPSEFVSQIPEHLTAAATPFEKHVMSELSIMRQMDHWTIEALADTNDYVRRTNGKTNRALEEVATVRAEVDSLKQDKSYILGGWKAVAGFCAVFAGVVAFILQVYSVLNSK